MRRVSFLFLMVLGWLVGVVSHDACAKPDVLDAKLGLQPDLTRVLFTLSGKIEYKIFTLADPYRIVIDMEEVNWRLPQGEKLLGQGAVTAMRYGRFKPGTSRIVIDLSGPVRVAQAVFLPGARPKETRLLIDLAPDSDARFRKSVSDTNRLRPPPTQQAAADAAPIAAAKKPKRRRPLIVIDPGHGGVDPGTISGDGVYEKDIVLAIARAVRAEIQASGRYQVRLTRDSDTFIPLRDRFRLARKAKADLFLSLHADANPNPRTRGASVYTLSDKGSDAEAEALAVKENKADVIAGLDLSGETPLVTNILIDLAQRDNNNQATRFASLLVGELSKEELLLEKPQRSASFAVLKAPDIPSALLENGYLSNTIDGKLLRDKKQQKKIAKAILRAFDLYFNWKNPAKPS
ncbi:MAG TPA: N-acetylmuramoyl-L-alanine amidase [Dongiaceae bacterium]|jgi:N-acetylmuramoyl-L-alanine amidase|nr:N-acetylmuramoyl-L-alanine amidase [Dongiaceae bacterium]